MASAGVAEVAITSGIIVPVRGAISTPTNSRQPAAGNETRFAWLAHGSAPRIDSRSGPRKTAVAFWPRESDHPGWLVDVLGEFAGRGVNLTRIESRPRKVGLGEYVFFVDLDGGVDEPAVAEGLAALQAHVAQLRMLGSFPAA
jgi:prephenate dehydratase